MCGIAGIITFNGQPVVSQQLYAMGEALAHRGPDGEGIWINANQSTGLAHRRLSIIDLSENASQPLHYLERYSVVFNGEIYNYIEIKERLLKSGYTFRSQSDTEVLLAAYAEYGARMLEHLDGMFAFAIWDEKEKKLFCARDRFGEKPFYYFYDQDNRLVFASEMKALFRVGVQQTVNQHMLYNFMVYHTEANPGKSSETFYDTVYSLEPAHYLIISANGKLEKHNYWKLKRDLNYTISFKEAEERFYELFELSLKRRLRSDVDVGSSLSGGIDSSVIVCLLNQLRGISSNSQNVFSARFHDPSKDEGIFMQKVIDATSVKPHFTWLDENVLINELENIMYYQEEPFGSSSIMAQWQVMKLAKHENVVVLLDGQGADETLGGYSHFFKPFFTELYLNDYNAFQVELKKYRELREADFPIDLEFKLNARYPNLMRVPGKVLRYFLTPEYCRFMSDEYRREYKNDQPPFNTFQSLNNALYYSTTVYGLGRLLRFADRNAMAHGREVRLPFLFHELVEFIFTLPSVFKIHNGWTKYILRKANAHVVPHEIIWRINKLGYETPQRTWMKHPDVKESIRNARKFLCNEKMLNPDFAHLCDDWVCLMVSTFLKQSKNI